MILTTYIHSDDPPSGPPKSLRQALQSVSIALGPQWLPWIIRELRSRLNRGFMIPVRGAAVLAALQALTTSKTLKSASGFWKMPVLESLLSP